MRGRGGRAGVQEIVEPRSYALELAVHLEARADGAVRAGDEPERILVLRGLAECLRQLEALDLRSRVIEQQQNVIMRRGERHG